MKIAITDANIFIDLLTASLLDAFAALDLEIITSYEVISELYPEQQVHLNTLLENGQLAIGLVDEPSFSEWRSIYKPSNGLSYPDQTVLFLAVKNDAMILSGEKLIRKFADRWHLEAHGILWVIDQLVDKEVIRIELAHIALTAIMVRNKWLPLDECNARLEKWSV